MINTNCLFFKEKKVSTYNDEISISSNIPWDLTGTVPADPLLGFLSACSEEEMDFNVTDKTLSIKGRKSHTDFNLREGEGNLIFPVVDEWEEIPKNFNEGIKITLFSAASDMTDPKLTCLHVKDNFIESCDKFRITRFTLDSNFPGEWLFPAWKVKFLLNFEPKTFAHSQGWAHFASDPDVIFSIRIFQDEYRNLDRFLVEEGEEVKIPSDVQGILERVAPIVKSDIELDELISVDLTENKMMITAKGPAGTHEEGCRVSYKGNPISFTLKPSLLSEILKLKSVGRVSESRIVFKGDNFIHSVSLS
jgi:DNA polymerase III sliding clamp (beta) subunit (PCNA family)